MRTISLFPVAFHAIITAAIILCGCTTTSIPRSTLRARSTAVNIEALAGGTTTIVLRSQPNPVKAHYFTLDGDSIFWTDLKTDVAASAAISDLGSFTIPDRAAGLFYGELAGAVAGYGVGAALSRQSNDRYLAVLSGALLGGITGYIIGVPRTYTIDMTR